MEAASDIFQRFLSPMACEAVNIDSRATKNAEEHLGNPSANMFDEAQSQVTSRAYNCRMLSGAMNG